MVSIDVCLSSIRNASFKDLEENFDRLLLESVNDPDLRERFDKHVYRLLALVTDVSPLRLVAIEEAWQGALLRDAVRRGAQPSPAGLHGGRP